MKKKKLSLLILLLTVTFSSKVFGLDLPPCKNNPDLVDKCFTVHGRLSVYNGTPGIRIWIIGTKRVLGVVPSEEEIMPKYLSENLTPGIEIYGDYLVCPFTKEKAGVMQEVCIESASKTRVKNLNK